MENLTKQLVFMETISKLREDLNDKILAYVEEHNMFGDYSIERLFEIGDGVVAFSFEVEWVEWDDPSYGKTIYFYLNDIDNEQTDGKFMYDINIFPLEFFYSNVLLANKFKPYN